MASVASIPYDSSPISDTELSPCGGCHNPVDDGNGVVVAFGCVSGLFLPPHLLSRVL